MSGDAHDNAGPTGFIIACGSPEVTDHRSWVTALAEPLPGFPDAPLMCVHSPADIPGALHVAAETRPGLPVTVVPLTTGRHPQTVADCARALRWARDHDGRDVRLAAPLADATATVAALRANIRKRVPEGAGAIIAAPAIDPFADAELVRIVRLAWQYGGVPVEPAFGGTWPDTDAATARLRLAGAGAAVTIRGDLALGGSDARGPRPDGSWPLWSWTAVRELVTARVRAADHLATGHGEDGVDASLGADHGHGHAHGHHHHHHHEGGHR